MEKSKKDLLFYGVRVNRGGKLEYTIISFDYGAYVMTLSNGSGGNKKEVNIPFSGFKSVKKYSNQAIELQTNVPDIRELQFVPLSKKDFSNLYQLLDNVIDNIDQLEGQSTLFQNLFESFKPKICLRRNGVTLKGLKIKGQKGKFQNFVKKTVKKPDPQSRTINLLLLTESHLICMDEKSAVPLYILPVESCCWKQVSDDTISVSCEGDKATFHFSDHDECAMWYEACLKAPDVEENIILDLEPIVRELQANYATQFDKENSEHVRLLRRLWEAASLGDDPEHGHLPFEIQSSRWQTIGFQRDDPISDLRASGLLGLQNLVYFAEKYTDLFLQMACGQQMAETEQYYPFATAGINISYLMVKLLHLRKGTDWYPSMETYPMFFYNRRAWEELYTIIFRFFDQKWNIMKVGYMGFQKVIEATESEISELIKKKSVQQGPDLFVPAIFDMLGILLENLDSFRTVPLNDMLKPASTETRISRSATVMDFRPKSEETIETVPPLDLDLSNIGNFEEVQLRPASTRRRKRGHRCRSANAPITPRQKATVQQLIMTSPRGLPVLDTSQENVL